MKSSTLGGGTLSAMLPESLDFQCFAISWLTFFTGIVQQREGQGPFSGGSLNKARDGVPGARL